MPILHGQVRDPRIRRTRKLLQDALYSLMRSKSFDEISVQDITDEATVNRATFYDHYTDKFALVEAMVGTGFHEFLDERQLRYEAGCPAALRAVIRATCDYLVQVLSSGACDHQTAFEPLMDAAVMVTIRQLLVEGLRRKAPFSAVTPELIAATASAAISGGVKQWLSSPGRADVQDFVTQLSELVLPVLEFSIREGSPAEAAVHSRP